MRTSSLVVTPGALLRSARTIASFLPALVVRRFGAAAAPPERPEVERLAGAVLFADISGFTALTERLAARGPRGAEELTALLNRSFGRLVGLIDEHGGEVVKFAGDALLALWRADEDNDLAAATLRAARCAGVVQGALNDVAADAQVRLTLRIGVGAGAIDVLYVGDPRHGWECVPTGDPLRQMATAERWARTGEVVLSPEAWRLVAARCAGDPRGEGCVRLRAVRAPLPDRPAPPPPSPDHGAALAAFVSGFLRDRIAAGQADWLSELRRVTVLFVNLGVDPDAPGLVERTQAAFEAVQSTLAQFEGALNKLAVDDKGMVALAALGLPSRAHEDDPARGVQAAMALREALRARGVRCAIGVTTGRVFCGVVGGALRREYTVMGDAVNLAARLMQHAADTILCDGATRAAAAGQVSFRALPALSVKGKARPVAVFEPRGESRRAAPRSPLVGRARERATLTGALDALLTGAGRAVVIEGETGLGKSRLVDAFLDHAARLGVECLTGAADSIERHTAYHPWRPIVGRLLGLDAYDAADAEGRRAHVRRRMAADPVLDRLAPLLRDVVALDLPDNELTAAMTGEVRAFNTQDLVVHLLRRAVSRSDGAPRPLAIVLDDAHWFDSASWALLRHVRDSVEPLLLLVATRPMSDPPAEYARLRSAGEVCRIDLAPLTPDETRELLARRLGGAPADDVARLVHERSGGNPFFTEELALALRAAGLVRADGDRIRLVDGLDPETVSLPDTAKATILTRIDRLDPRQQLLVKVASVIGRTFAFRVLHHIYPVEADRPALRHKLEELEDLDLTLRAASEPELTYRYKQKTTREVAYDLLLYAQRRRLHRAVAETLEANAPPNMAPLYPRLAHHWARADEPEKTLYYLEKAGEQALLEGTYREGAGHFREALRRLSAREAEGAPADPFRRGRWERLLGEAQLGLGNLPESRAALERAVALFGFPVPASPVDLAVGLARGAGR